MLLPYLKWLHVLAAVTAVGANITCDGSPR